MRVLVACEFSGIVRDAFRRKGHDAISCDILPSEMPGPHIVGDVLELLDDHWDLMIAHPPCTYLAVSGASYFKNRQLEQSAALEFVKRLLNAPVPRICVENPVSVISTYIRKPDQIVQPWWFGDSVQKTTCLWLKNLPLLTKTQVVEPEWTTYKKLGKRVSRHHYDTFYLPPNIRGHIRSITFKGLAAAMAEQWGISRVEG